MSIDHHSSDEESYHSSNNDNDEADSDDDRKDPDYVPSDGEDRPRIRDAIRNLMAASASRSSGSSDVPPSRRSPSIRSISPDPLLLHDANVASSIVQPNVSDHPVEVEPRRIPGIRRRSKKKNLCVLCDKLYAKFSNHYHYVHARENGEIQYRNKMNLSPEGAMLARIRELGSEAKENVERFKINQVQEGSDIFANFGPTQAGYNRACTFLRSAGFTIINPYIFPESICEPNTSSVGAAQPAAQTRTSPPQQQQQQQQLQQQSSSSSSSSTFVEALHGAEENIADDESPYDDQQQQIYTDLFLGARNIVEDSHRPYVVTDTATYNDKSSAKAVLQRAGYYIRLDTRRCKLLRRYQVHLNINETFKNQPAKVTTLVNRAGHIMYLLYKNEGVIGQVRDPIQDREMCSDSRPLIEVFINELRQIMAGHYTTLRNYYRDLSLFYKYLYRETGSVYIPEKDRLMDICALLDRRGNEQQKQARVVTSENLIASIETQRPYEEFYSLLDRPEVVERLQQVREKYQDNNTAITITDFRFIQGCLLQILFYRSCVRPQFASLFKLYMFDKPNRNMAGFVVIQEPTSKNRAEVYAVISDLEFELFEYYYDKFYLKVVERPNTEILRGDRRDPFFINFRYGRRLSQPGNRLMEWQRDFTTQRPILGSNLCRKSATSKISSKHPRGEKNRAEFMALCWLQGHSEPVANKFYDNKTHPVVVVTARQILDRVGQGDAAGDRSTAASPVPSLRASSVPVSARGIPLSTSQPQSKSPSKRPTSQKSVVSPTKKQKSSSATSAVHNIPPSASSLSDPRRMGNKTAFSKAFIDYFFDKYPILINTEVCPPSASFDKEDQILFPPSLPDRNPRPLTDLYRNTLHRFRVHEFITYLINVEKCPLSDALTEPALAHIQQLGPTWSKRRESGAGILNWGINLDMVRRELQQIISGQRQLFASTPITITHDDRSLESLNALNREIHRHCTNQSWPGIVPLTGYPLGNKQQRGVVTIISFLKGDVVCDYRGVWSPQGEIEEKLQLLEDNGRRDMADRIRDYLLYVNFKGEKWSIVGYPKKQNESYYKALWLGPLINHSFKHPNLEAVPYECTLEDGRKEKQVLFRAMCNIPADTQLTFDYGKHFHPFPWGKTCLCRSCNGACWCKKCDHKKRHDMPPMATASPPDFDISEFQGASASSQAPVAEEHQFGIQGFRRLYASHGRYYIGRTESYGQLCAVYALARALRQAGMDTSIADIRHGLQEASHNTQKMWFTFEVIALYLIRRRIPFLFINQQTNPDSPTVTTYGITNQTPARNIVGLILHDEHWEYITSGSNLNAYPMDFHPLPIISIEQPSDQERRHLTEAENVDRFVLSCEQQIQYAADNAAADASERRKMQKSKKNVPDDSLAAIFQNKTPMTDEEIAKALQDMEYSSQSGSW